MADDIQLNVGTGGDKARAKDRTTSKTHIVALDLNPAGAESLMAGSMPVTNTGTFAVRTTSIVPGVGATNLGKEIDSVAGATDTGVAVVGVRDDVLSALTPVEGDYTPVRVDANGALWVIPSGAVVVSNAGTFAVQVDGSALTALQLLDDTVFADDATFTAGTSKLNAVGGMAAAHGTAPSAVAAGDACVGLYNRHRIPFVIGGHPNVVTSSVRIPAASGAQTDAAIGPGTVNAGTKVVVTRITATCSNANSVNVGVKLGFGATTLPADSTSGAAAVLVDHDGVPPGGGFTVGDGSGILGIGGDGEELRLTCDSPTGGSVIVTVSYYLIES